MIKIPDMKSVKKIKVEDTKIILGTQMPGHCDFSDCCGFFNDLQETGLYCNECGVEISKAFGNFYKEVKETINAMWGGSKRGVHMNFNKCETDALRKWLELSAKFGIIEKGEQETEQIGLNHICNGCTELIIGHNKKPFCALEVLEGKCIKEYYKDKDDYLAYQDDEIDEMRRNKWMGK